MKFAAQLAFGGHISVEWFGPNGDLITRNSLIGRKENSNIGSTRTLTIERTNLKHTGLYSCHVTLDLPSTHLSHNVTTQYHLVLLSEFLMHYLE